MQSAFNGLFKIVLSLLFISSTLNAQIASNESWKTIRTKHFRIHFPEAHEATGRKVASIAEISYENLAKELVRPRGTIDLVLTDAVDGSNGSAGIFPRSRIVIQLRPPVDQTTLQSFDNWLELVVQHEVAHIFHIDRTRGLWRAAQYIVGRNTITFPNAYVPSWIKEGIAVYYESKFVSGGRLDGTYIHDLVNSAARDSSIPRLGDLSLVRSKYPMGQVAYTYGAVAIDRLVKIGKDGGLRSYIERTSSTLIPYILDHQSERAFGTSFSRSWEEWKDSVYDNRDPESSKTALRWKIVKQTQRYTYYPRWWNDSTVVYVGDDGVQPIQLYESIKNGRPRALGRRTSSDVNVLRSDGAVIFAQSDYVDRFNIKSDLYRYANGHTKQLTKGERLSSPDVRFDGHIAAVQTVDGNTNLVYLPYNAKSIRTVAAGNDSTNWAYPRWSPDGSAVASVRFQGDKSAIVLVDSTGNIREVIGETYGTVRSPAWTSDGSAIVFISDRSGSYRIYHYVVGTGLKPKIIGDSATFGFFDIDVISSVAEPDILKIAATFQDEKGFRLATTTVDLDSQKDIAFSDAEFKKPQFDSKIEAVADYSNAPVRKYRSWSNLIPAYWNPLIESGSGSPLRLGASTSSYDPVNRHTYYAQAYINTENNKLDAAVSYGYERFANPIFRFSADQVWSYSPIIASGVAVGEVAKRSNTLAMHVRFVRPKRFSNTAVTFGAEMELNHFEITPDSLTGNVPSHFHNRHAYPTLLAAFQFNNALKPPLSPSPQDGITFSSSIRQRWKYGTSGQGSQSAVAIGSAYKSIGLFGYARHVFAFRLSGGIADANSPSDFALGGISGSSLEILPGLTIGDNNRTFPLRGFAPGIQRGTRAYSGSFEYRAPLFRSSVGAGLLPLFFDRSSVTVFADAGKAFCSGSGAPVCTAASFNNPVLASAGAELISDIALQYDTEYRVRLGFAKLLRSSTANLPVSFYLSFGTNF